MSYFFECIFQPMEHVGKRCQIKKRPSPFWQRSQQSPVHRGLSSDAPRLQKQQNITSLLPQIKEPRWKGGEGRSTYKKAAKFLHCLNPHQAHSPEDWESWEPSVTDLSVAVNVPVAECRKGKGEEKERVVSPHPSASLHGSWLSNWEK